MWTGRFFAIFFSFAMGTNIRTQLRNIFRMIKVIPFDFHFLHHNLFLLCTPIKRTVESRYEHCVCKIVRWGTGKIFQGQISNMVLYPTFSLFLSFSHSQTVLAIYTHLLCRFALEIQNAMSFFSVLVFTPYLWAHWVVRALSIHYVVSKGMENAI